MGRNQLSRGGMEEKLTQVQGETKPEGFTLSLKAYKDNTDGWDGYIKDKGSNRQSTNFPFQWLLAKASWTSLLAGC